MKKQIVTFLIVSLSVVSLLGQDSYIKNRMNFKAGYSRYNTGRYQYSGSSKTAEKTGNYRLEGNYGITKYFEAGLYFGLSSFDLVKVNWADSSAIMKNFIVPFYGINVNFHLLPLVVESNDFRFDLYLTGKLGGLYFSTPPGYNMHGHINEYGAGAGFSFYLSKHLGFYSEYCFGKYYVFTDRNFRYGLTFKF